MRIDRGLFSSRPVRRDPDFAARWFKRVTVFAVMGYVFFDRAFAYLHVPGFPVYSGEVVLLIAVIVLLRFQRQTVAVLRGSTLMRMAILLFVWGLLRLAFDLPRWGLTALRDAAQTNYIVIGLAMAVIVLREPDLSRRLMQLRRWVPTAVVVWSPIAIVLNRLFSRVAPAIPGTETSIVSFKPGDYALFMVAAVTYVWISGEAYSVRYRNMTTAIGSLGLLVAFSQNRGGVLGALILGSVAALFVPRTTRRNLMATSAVTIGVVIVVLALGDYAISLGSRSFSAEQLTSNVLSVFGGTENQGLENTVTWRLDYWQLVVDDVVKGHEWLTGLGYGTNLASLYGFQTSLGPQPLRSAHNSHVTLLARLGLVGLMLWLTFWLQMIISLTRRARRRVEPIIGWLTAAILGIGVAAVFDPILEGPQIAIPFWCAVGMVAAATTRLPGSRRRPVQQMS